MKIKQHTLKHPIGQEEIIREIKEYLKTIEKEKHNITIFMRCSESSSKREIYSYKCLH